MFRLMHGLGNGPVAAHGAGRTRARRRPAAGPVSLDSGPAPA